VNTQVALDLSNMEVNSTYNENGNQIFNYVHADNLSTYIDSWNLTMPHIPPYPVTLDNGPDWNNGQKFTFSAGTIMVNQTWMVNFTLTALTEGNIKVLNSKTSQVTFLGTQGSVPIPDTFVTAVPVGTEAGPNNIIFDITDLQRTNDNSDTQIAQLNWTPHYNGVYGEINWEIWLAYPNSNAFGFVEGFGTQAIFPNSINGFQNDVTYNLPIGDLPPGTYTVRVRGKHPPDAPNDVDRYLQIIIPQPTAAPQILIQ